MTLSNGDAALSIAVDGLPNPPGANHKLHPIWATGPLDLWTSPPRHQLSISILEPLFPSSLFTLTPLITFPFSSRCSQHRKPAR